MKATRLQVKNIGILKDNIDIPIDKPLIIFYGDIRQGKSTILNSITLLFGGSFSNDIIRHGQKDAFVELTLENGYIRREFYIDKNNVPKARQIKYVKDGRAIDDKVTAEVLKLVNPFQLDAEFFNKKNDTQKNQYLLELFGVDTSQLDNENKLIEFDAKELRIKIKSYGEIDLTEHVLPNFESLKKEKSDIDKANNKIQSDYDIILNKIINDNEKSVKRSNNISQCNIEISTLDKTIEDLIFTLETAKARQLKCKEWLSDNPPIDKTKHPEKPKFKPTTDVDTKISNAKVDELKYNTYLANVKKDADKQKDQKSLSGKESRQREIKREKSMLLTKVSNKIKGLNFDNNGNFRFEDTANDMISDSQRLRLNSELSALYPEGLGLELIDRGESLGSSIYTLIDNAKRSQRNILVAKVGDKPAEKNDDIGVFVVDNGNVTK